MQSVVNHNKILRKRFNGLGVILTIVFHAFLLVNFAKTSVNKNIFSLNKSDAQSLQTVVKLVSIQKSEPRLLPKIAPKKAPLKKAVQKKKTVEEKVQNLSKNKQISKGIQSLRAKYYGQIRDLINNKKYYPRSARRMGHTGRVVLDLSIDKSGLVTMVKVNTKARYNSLNKSALKTIQRLGNKFPPIPEKLGQDLISLKVPVLYSLN